MYGAKVHEAVISSKSTESGISIHYVNEHYDEGDAILQVKCPVFSDDTCESLAIRDSRTRTQALSGYYRATS
jgi:phosphoribosylglycinamide formyltransferase 1